MIIDFNDIAEQQIDGFKGGKGLLRMHAFADDKCKVMLHKLAPGASTGLHVHDGNCEVVYVLRGELTFHYDEQVEVCRTGQVHYCPMGHAHYMENLTDGDTEYLAIVPTIVCSSRM